MYNQRGDNRLLGVEYLYEELPGRTSTEKLISGLNMEEELKKQLIFYPQDAVS